MRLESNLFYYISDQEISPIWWQDVNKKFEFSSAQFSNDRYKVHCFDLYKSPLFFSNYVTSFNQESRPVTICFGPMDLRKCIVSWSELNSQGIDFYIARNEGPEKIQYVFNQALNLSKQRFQNSVIKKYETSDQKCSQFLYELSESKNMNDFVAIIHKEFQKFHRMGEVFLISENKMLNENEMFYFQNTHLVKKIISVNWEQLEKFNPLDCINESDSSVNTHLLNGTQICFPLHPSDSFLPEKGALIFRNKWTQDQINSWETLWSSHFVALKNTYNNLVMLRNLKHSQKIWSATFDQIKDPIVVVSNENTVLRTNTAFDETFSENNSVWQNAINNKKVIFFNHKIFAIETMSVLLENKNFGRGTIYCFKNITQALSLEERWLQKRKIESLSFLFQGLKQNLLPLFSEIEQGVALGLHEPSLSKQTKNNLTEIYNSAQKSQQILQSLGTLIPNGADSFLQPTSITSAIEECLQLFKVSLMSHQVLMTSEVEHPRTLVDPILFNQVLFNIIKNAIQSMETKGTLSIHIQSTEWNKKPCWSLAIGDTGSGISPEDLPFVFMPFFTTKKNGQGTGLGLSLCQKVIEKFKGHMELKSELGKGTTVFIFLLLCKE
ncbi:MAG: hypothetical protein K1X29_06485 [Bdellovibrionales bacterium]|nr:hypothetical protein [Bdellovibrionales bacterium]